MDFWLKQYIVVLLLFLHFHKYCETVVLGGAGIAGAAIAISTALSWWAGGRKVRCYFEECCDDRWTRPESAKKDEIINMFKKELFGQHLVMQIVPNAVYHHIFDENPQKALVMSFHGWTGCGKNYVANLISKYIYREETDSKFRHVKISSQDYPDPTKIDEYKRELCEFIETKTKICGRSLFIFDEMDKMPLGLTDVLKPYIDYYHKIDGVDYRKNMFIFLNNIGGDQISAVALNNFQEGNAREIITSSAMEHILSLSSLKLQGGFKDSNLISTGLIDFFVPFLPLERHHVKECASVEIKRHINKSESSDNGGSVEKMDRETQRKIADKVADEIQFYPKGENIFSNSGCKQVSKKVDMYI